MNKSISKIPLLKSKTDQTAKTLSQRPKGTRYGKPSQGKLQIALMKSKVRKGRIVVVVPRFIDDWPLSCPRCHRIMHSALQLDAHVEECEPDEE
jgi:hypothetical protein